MGCVGEKSGRQYFDLNTVKDEVFRLYLEEELPLYKIGKKYGVSHITVGKFLRNHGIKIRSRKDALIKNNERVGKRVYRECEWCGKEFHVTGYYMSGGPSRGRFCSNECYRNFVTEEATIILKCEQCGEDFSVLRNRLDSNAHSGRFCSRECFNRYKYEQIDFGNFTCANCGIDFVIKNERRQCARQYCSRKCLYEHNRGENSPLYKGAPPDAVMKVRNCVKSKKWKTKVRKRDNYTCADCRTEHDPYSRDLHVHHLRPFSDILAEFLKIHPFENTLEWKKEVNKYAPFWDLSNAVCLCADCHAKRHAK